VAESGAPLEGGGMSRDAMTRWLIATGVFVAIAYYGSAVSHPRALGLLVVALVVIAVFGGHRRSS
jgi:hypothetical protein